MQKECVQIVITNDNKKFISVNFKLNENEKNNQCDNDVIEV